MKVLDIYSNRRTSKAIYFCCFFYFLESKQYFVAKSNVLIPLTIIINSLMNCWPKDKTSKTYVVIILTENDILRTSHKTRIF